MNALHAGSESKYGIRHDIIHDPEGFIECVNVLLNVEIAGKPRVIIPVADLVLHFGITFTAGTLPKLTCQIEEAAADDIADFTVLDPVNHFNDIGMIPPAEPRDK